MVNQRKIESRPSMKICLRLLHSFDGLQLTYAGDKFFTGS